MDSSLLSKVDYIEHTAMLNNIDIKNYTLIPNPIHSELAIAFNFLYLGP